MTRRRDRATRAWSLYAPAGVAIAAIVIAITDLGPPTSSARTEREVVTAADGVVQTTVSGTGNVEPATDQEVNFRTSGMLQTVNVAVGQHVSEGQLLATLDPSAAELALAQAQASLTAADDELTAAEDGSSAGSGSAGAATAASLAGTSSRADFVAYTPGPGTTTAGSSTVSAATAPSRSRTTATRTVTVTVPTPTRRTSATRTTPATGTTTPARTTTSAPSAPSPAQIAQAQASVDSAEANVRSAQTALDETKLYAPVSGTIASLESDAPGTEISAAGGSGSGSSSPAGSGTGSAASAAGAGSVSAGGLGISSGSGSSSSSSAFVQIINSSTLTMTVAFSESDIASVRVGQPATISIDALSGVELEGHVTSISPVGTSSQGVVSYDATLTLDQNNPKVRPGMSASATVITGQAQGVTVPNQAVTGSGPVGAVEQLINGKSVAKQVVVGLRGSNRTQIVSGLSSGQQLVVTVTLPALGTTSTPSSSFGGALGRGGFGGGVGALLRGAGGGFGGAGAFFRGAGAG